MYATGEGVPKDSDEAVKWFRKVADQRNAFEQYNLDSPPGLTSGVEPAKMQLFDLKADPGEQQDVAAAHPSEVKRLKALFDVMNRDVPVVEEVKRMPIK